MQHAPGGRGLSPSVFDAVPTSRGMMPAFDAGMTTGQWRTFMYPGTPSLEGGGGG